MGRIDSNKLYRLTVAATLLPSERTDGHLHVKTLQKLVRSRVIKGQRKPGGRFWWIHGSELLRYLRAIGRLPAMSSSASTATVLDRLRAKGVRLEPRPTRISV